MVWCMGPQTAVLRLRANLKPALAWPPMCSLSICTSSCVQEDCQLQIDMYQCRLCSMQTGGASDMGLTLSSRSQGSRVRYVASSSAATCRQIHP